MALDVAIVIVDDAPAETDAGENDAVAPEGSPLAESVTDWAEPEVSAVETVAPTLAPAVTLPELGLTASEKSLVAVQLTIRLRIAVCDEEGDCVASEAYVTDGAANLFLSE